MMSLDGKKCATSPDYAIGQDRNKFNGALRPMCVGVQTLSCLLDATEILGLLTSKAELIAADEAVGLKLNALVAAANLETRKAA